MGPFVLAWLFGEGLITWRAASQQHMPPSPRQLLLASGLYAGLAVVAEYGPARVVATGFAWAVNVAVLMRVLPGSGDTAAIGKGKAGGWASIGATGNTVIIPDGTAASTQVSTAAAVTGSSSGSGAGGTSTGTAGSGGSAAANQQVAKQVIAANPQFSGWDTGQQWADLVSLWTRESSWINQNNQGSGAAGIPQSLGHPQYGQPEFGQYGLDQQQVVGANQGNIADQVLWGLNYIARTYGTPSAAWQHEQSHGWY